MPTPERISLHEAAERLGVHYMTVYRYVRTGRLDAVREGVQWLVDPRDLDAMRSPGRSAAGHGAVRAESVAKLAGRMVAGDEAGAWSIVEAALTSGVEPASVHLDLLLPALVVVGDGWAAETLTVADEHRATAVAQRIVGRLGPRFARRGRKRGTVVLGAPPGELHALPTAIVGDLLRGVGFEVLDIGADAPAESFAETALRASRLVAIAIAATTPNADRAVRSAIRAVRASGVDGALLVGGAAIADEAHARRLGADGWSGPDARAAIEAIEAAADARR